MNEAVQTLDGWYVLHDFRAIDWSAWKKASPEERAKAMDELFTMMSQWSETERQKKRKHRLLQHCRAKSRFHVYAAPRDA